MPPRDPRRKKARCTPVPRKGCSSSIPTEEFGVPLSSDSRPACSDAPLTESSTPQTCSEPPFVLQTHTEGSEIPGCSIVVPGIEETYVSAPARRRGRGPSNGTTVEAVFNSMNGKKIPVVIGLDQRDEGNYSSLLTHHVGNAVRTLLPLAVRKFKDLKEEEFIEAYAFIQDKFDNDLENDGHKEVIRSTMKAAFQKHRAYMHKWFKEHGGNLKED